RAYSQRSARFASSRTACRSTAASASRGSTTCTSISGAAPPTLRITERRTSCAARSAGCRPREELPVPYPVTAVEDCEEDVESFRQRARAWLKAEMPLPDTARPELGSEERWARARTLQRQLYDAGFAGICYPREYGGQGLSFAHQQAFSEESLPYEMPI